MIARLFSDNRGGAAAELAVIMPFLALLVIGVADFGRVYVTGSVVAHAAQAGAYYGSQSPAKAIDTDGIANAARQDASDVSSIVVSSSRFCSCGVSDAFSCTAVCSDYGTAPDYGPPRMFVRVTVSKTYNFILRYPGLPSSKTVSSVATLRVN